ncbi:MAG: nucleoside-diphosphate kinase [Patescibacteria group bacterium]|nr:nucleoside-diphosphate kinase [Patescibacteria group bacterium]
MKHDPAKEQTLVVLKPDAVLRGVSGEIITRFEKVGLKIVAMRMLDVTKELAEKHYPVSREEWVRMMGEKTLENYEKYGISAKERHGTEDTLELGKMIREWLIEYMQESPVIAMVLEGPHACELVRKMLGHTLPLLAAPGTIRGDYAYDSSYLANKSARAIKNLVHASGTVEEAMYEIPLWFDKSHIFSYTRVEEKVMQE